MNQDPVPDGAILVSAAARVLAVQPQPPVKIPDPTADDVAIQEGPGFRVELDLPDRRATLLLEYRVKHGAPPAAADRDDIALLTEWRDLDVELELYELPWHAVRLPTRAGTTIRWSGSRWVTRLLDPLGRHVDLPVRRELDRLLPPWERDG